MLAGVLALLEGCRPNCRSAQTPHVRQWRAAETLHTRCRVLHGGLQDSNSLSSGEVCACGVHVASRYGCSEGAFVQFDGLQAVFHMILIVTLRLLLQSLWVE